MDPEAERILHDLKPLSSDLSREEFTAFYDKHRTFLQELIQDKFDQADNLNDLELRAGMFDPMHAAIDDRIRQFCKLEYEHSDGKTYACPGSVNNWKGCPPYSTSVADTLVLLEKATAFILIQFDDMANYKRQRDVNNFTTLISNVLSSKGLSVLATYDSGPCRTCATCCVDGPCRLPGKRTFSLEAVGFHVDHLCRQAAAYPILGDDNWPITWIVDWGRKSQWPRTFKSVTGILLA